MRWKIIVSIIFAIIVVFSFAVNAKERIVCKVEIISDNTIKVELKWANNYESKNNIRITGWNFIDDDILKIKYVQGESIIIGWNTREIVSEKYTFPMKVILEEQPKVEKTIFSDIPTNSEDKYSILNLYYRGIINGYPDGMFKPNNSVTRAEFAAMIVRTAEYEERTKSYASIFKDVSNDYWGKSSIMTLANKNILNGRGNNLFDPNGAVTIGEAIAIIDRTFLFYKNDKNYNFKLQEHWSNNNFYSLVSSDIIKNTDKFYFPYIPNVRASRKNCALLLSRVIEQINETK